VYARTVSSTKEHRDNGGQGIIRIEVKEPAGNHFLCKVEVFEGVNVNQAERIPDRVKVSLFSKYILLL